jgi:oxygen-dependent protoporphyrinogen oxidase
MKVVVVGGGISGLAAAHRVVEIARDRALDVDVALVESRDRLGGTIATDRVDGFVVEAGPDSFLSEKPWALALCERIGLESRLIGTDDRHRRVFVWRRGRLHPVPEGFQLLAPTRVLPFVTSGLFSPAGKLRMALDLVLPRGGHGDDESLGSFVRRRLGRQALERIAQPLVAGIYTADPDDLSLAATMPRFLELERRERSLILGLARAGRRARPPGTSGARWSLFVSLAAGMGELVDALAARLPAGAVHLQQRATGIERAGARWRVGLAGAPAMDADRVVLATEAHAGSRLLRYVDPPLAEILQLIPYASSVTVSLGYRRADVPHPLDGFGFVVPRTEGRDLLACTFSSVKYPGRAPDGHALLRCFLGGALNPGLLERDDEALVRLAREEVRSALGIAADPVLVRLARHPASMPQYAVGHLARVETIERRAAALPGLHLAGGGHRGVGIADCVRSGEAAADAAVLGAPAAHAATG